MVKGAIIGILAIFAVSLLAVVSLNEITGQYSRTSSTYGTAKIYGPGLKNAHKNPSLNTRGNYYYDIKEAQDFMYANQDKWVCQYADPAGDDPCVWDSEKEKWCCIPTDINFNY